MTKKRYAVCGVSARAIYSYVAPMCQKFSHCAELVGLLDIDPLRFKVCKEAVPEAKNAPEYMAEDFEKMIAETKPDALLVVSMDCTHVKYIVAGLEHLK